ncbi:MAG: hypothetical protein HKN24_08865 [Acidimicrobiales bacterium]|nr:hypothetical protein [Acidimicrobiales bacterium]
MSAIHFTVPVAADPHRVAKRFEEAAKNPSEFVYMFTTSDDIYAEVAEGGDGVWRVWVEGPQFTSRGTAAVASRHNGESDIDIQVDVRGKGFFGFASPLLALAAGRVEDEAARALQHEFGAPSST